jgi:hypothetical protein
MALWCNVGGLPETHTLRPDAKKDGVMEQREKQKEFFGMKYPFKECARPRLLWKRTGEKDHSACLNCSVEQFCEAPEKQNEEVELGEYAGMFAEGI